jgi:hypothetical protein
MREVVRGGSDEDVQYRLLNRTGSDCSWPLTRIYLHLEV